MAKKVTLLDLYNVLDDVVNKYPYYEFEIRGVFENRKVKPTLYIDRKNRKVWLDTMRIVL